MLPKASSWAASRASGDDVDAPALDILAVVVARRQPQHLDHAGRGRIVAVDRAVGDAKAHGGYRGSDRR